MSAAREFNLKLDRRMILIGAALTLLAGGIAAWLTRADLSGLGVTMFPGFVYVLLTDLWIPLLWLGASLGIGLALHRLLFGHEYDEILVLALGVGGMLFLDHALGLIGFLQASEGAGAWILCAIGIALFIVFGRDALRQRALNERGWEHSWIALTAAPGLALLLIAATSVPGWLWLSEAHGYDVLSYHLQLPREWLALGRIQPLEHNVYSFLPSYMEAAYYHLAILYQPFRGDYADGTIRAACACQLLHAALTIALAFGVLAPIVARRAGGYAGAFAAAIAVNLPWMIVDGSMAYNEIPTLILLAAGLVAALDGRFEGGWRSGLALGLITGLACGAKPTSIGFVAAPLVVVSMMCTPRNHWLRLLIGGAIGGLIALAPWLIRNAIYAGGNPFFPFTTGLFGAAHWTAEQAARWDAAHTPDLAIGERFARLVDFALLHRQWAGLWFIAILGGGIAAWLMPQRRRTLSLLAIIVAIQLLFWFIFTHAQSRFLLPAAVPMLIATGFGVSTLLYRLGEPRRRRIARGIALAIIPLVLGAWSIALYSNERSGKPATYIDGLALRTGAAFADHPQRFRDELLANPDAFLSYLTGEEFGLLLVGDATPFYIQRPLRWHTTWDRSPIGDLVREHPGDPAAWRRGLYEQGIRLVLVNYAELSRLIERDAWYDPAVTIERINTMLDDGATGVISWPLESKRPTRALYRLNPPPSTEDQ